MHLKWEILKFIVKHDLGSEHLTNDCKKYLIYKNGAINPRLVEKNPNLSCLNWKKGFLLGLSCYLSFGLEHLNSKPNQSRIQRIAVINLI